MRYKCRWSEKPDSPNSTTAGDGRPTMKIIKLEVEASARSSRKPGAPAI